MMMPVSIGSDDPCTIRRYVYADDAVIVPDQIILTIGGQDVQANTIYPDGYYEITEDLEIGSTGTFTVVVDGAPYLAMEANEPITVTIYNSIFKYRVDLTINLPPPNSPPYAPTNPSPTRSNAKLDCLLTWDYTYNPDSGVLTYDDYIYNKYNRIFQELNTPGFELITLLAVIALVVILMKKRK